MTASLPKVVIASEAKQSIGQCKERMDCFVVSLLAMTTRYDSAFPRRDSPELCENFGPLQTEGAGNAGRLVRPLSRVRKS
jgi:hypothetical protein